MEKILLVISIFAFIAGYYVYHSFTLFLIAKKTYASDKWLAWIPLVNFVLMARIANVSEWWLVAFFVPLMNIVVMLMLYARMAEARGKNQFTCLGILFPFGNLAVQSYLAFSR